MAVFVFDRRKKPLMPCNEKRARKLLKAGRARVHRLIPFSIRIVDHNVSDCVLQPIKIKLDSGSKTTGNFNIQSAHGVVQGISYRYCKLIQRSDGYAYA
jgi:hypothetical protein